MRCSPGPVVVAVAVVTALGRRRAGDGQAQRHGAENGRGGDGDLRVRLH